VDAKQQAEASDDDDAEVSAQGGEAADDDEAGWPSSLALNQAQRELAQERERVRVAKLALERAETQLTRAQDKATKASDALHDERAWRHARAERRAERELKRLQTEGATAPAAKLDANKGGAETPSKAAPRAAPREAPSEASEIESLVELESKAPPPVEALLTKLRGLAHEAVSTDVARDRGRARARGGVDRTLHRSA